MNRTSPLGPPRRALGLRTGAPVPLDATERVVGGGALLAAGTLHAVVVAPHATDDPLTGAFFLLVQIVQLSTGLAVLVTRGPPATWSLRAGGASSIGVLLVYLLSRTVGLPLGPDEAPTIGAVDGVAAILEVAAGWAALSSLRRRRRSTRPSRTASAAAAALIALLTLYAVAVGRDPADGAAVEAELSAALAPIGEPPGTVDASVVATLTATTATFGASEPFVPVALELPAGTDAVIRFTNADEDARHNLSLFEPGSRGAALFTGRIIAPGEAVDLPFTTPRAGRYALRCDLHPWMQTTLTTGG